MARPIFSDRARDLAVALQLVSRANHYMVGITFQHSQEELDVAEQILIDSQNGINPLAGAQERNQWEVLERALDLVVLLRTEHNQGGRTEVYDRR